MPKRKSDLSRRSRRTRAQKIARSKETPVQAELRRQEQARRQSVLRASESTSQRLKRLKSAAERMAAFRARKTAKQQQARKAVHALRQTSSLQNLKQNNWSILTNIINAKVEKGLYDKVECDDFSPKSPEVENLEITPDLYWHWDNEDGMDDIPDITGLDTNKKSLASNIYNNVAVKSEPSYPDHEQYHISSVEDFGYSNNGGNNISNASDPDMNEKSLTSTAYDTIVVKAEPSDPDYEKFDKTCIEDSTYSNVDEKEQNCLSYSTAKQPVTTQSSRTVQEICDTQNKTYLNKRTISKSLLAAYLRMKEKDVERIRLYREEINQQRKDKGQCQQNSLPIHPVSIVQNTDKIEKFTPAASNNQLHSILIPQQYFKINKQQINYILNSKRKYCKTAQEISESTAATPAERSRKYRERKKEEIKNRRAEESLSQQKKPISESTAATPAERSRKYRERKKEEIKKRRAEKSLSQQKNVSLKSKVNDAFYTKMTETTKDCDGPLVSLTSHPTDSVLKKNIADILKQCDLESITMRGVIQKVFDMYPKFDLSYKKEFIKETLRFILYKLGEEQNSNKEVEERNADSPDCCLTTTRNSESISESAMECL